FGHRQHLQTCALGFLPRSTPDSQTDGDVAARVFQIVGLCESLAAVADHCDLFLTNEIEFRIFVVVDFHVCLLCCVRVCACSQSVDSNVSCACDVSDANRSQQLDKRVDLFFISRCLDDALRVRDIDDLRAKHTHETQHFLALIS